MASETSDEIKKRIDALPANVREYIYSPQMNAAVQQIGAKHQLHVDQIGELESEAVAAMIGITEMQNLSENLSDSLSIEKIKSDALAKDLNDQVFLKIRESMKKVETSPTTSTPASPSTPPTAATPKPPPPVTNVDMMLSQSTVSVPKVAQNQPPNAPAAPQNPPPAPATPKIVPPNPGPYKADPYREPPE